MKKRKLIGVIISEVEGLYQNRLLEGIISQCFALDHDIAIFTTFIKNNGMPEYKIGEKNIYNLINFELFDGIIVAGLTLAIPNLQTEIEQRLKAECDCPVLYVDQSAEYYPSIYTDDETSAKKIVDHLIEEHGYTDIFCLAGAPEISSTINRVKGYKASLTEHNITIDESRISYDGNFYYQGGEALARKIISGEISKPQAIMAINDHMAIGLINEFRKHGICVPEDIAVTGYDATEDAAINKVMITTYAPPVAQIGAEAICKLTEMMTGCKPEVHNLDDSHLEIGHSCGCNNVDYMRRGRIKDLREKSEDYKALLDSYMTEALTVATSYEECIDKIRSYLYLIKDYTDYYLCLCDNWDGSKDNYQEQAELIHGYTDTMTVALTFENRTYVESNNSFDVKEMHPDLWKDRAKPKAYFFTPVHFNEHCIGYSVLTYMDKAAAFDIIYRNWSRNIMNALEYNRFQRKLSSYSLRDVLTGIYNRSGLDLKLPIILNEAVNERKKLFVIMADLDNLKTVNDWYGHKAGDHIISVVASGFYNYCKTHDICVRIGGDEFLVVGIEREDEPVDNFINAVKEYINHFNETSKKPYQIEISIGAICDYVRDINKLKDMIDRADHIMYYNKAINKKDRISWIRNRS